MRMLIIFIILFTININAKIIYVDGKGYSSENNDGTSWDNALGFIKDALDSAQIGDKIWFLNNDGYNYNIDENDFPLMLNGNIYYQLYGGFEGTETSIKERKYTNKTEIDGINAYYYRGFDVYYLLEQYNDSYSPFLGSVDSVLNKKSNNILIDGFTFISFDTPVIVFSGKKMIIENCDFKYNIGLGTSAILANCDSVILKNCKIFNNYAYLIPIACTNSKYYGNCIRLLNKSNQYINIENSVIVNIDPAMNIPPNTQIEIVNSLIGAVNSDTLSNYYSDNPVFVIEDGAKETNVNVISKNNIFIGDVDTLIRKSSKNCIFTSYLNYSNYI